VQQLEKKQKTKDTTGKDGHLREVIESSEYRHSVCERERDITECIELRKLDSACI
jgi:hypothetical protein